MGKKEQTSNANYKERPQRRGKPNRVTKSITRPVKTGRGNRVDRQSEEIIDTAKAVIRDAQPRRGNWIQRDGTENDPEWYANDPQLLKDVYSFPTAYALGSPFSKKSIASNAAYITTSKQYYVPGIMSLEMIPIPGISNPGTTVLGAGVSAVNLAAYKLYEYLAHNNGRNPNYERSDLMMYLLGLDNIYCLWNYLARVYGILGQYSSRNKYLPKALIATMNIDFDDIVEHANDLRFLLNYMSTQISTFYCPANLSYFKRHAWLFSNVFQDAPDSSKAQLVLYNPSHLYSVDIASSSTELTKLTPVAITASDTPWSFHDIRSLVNQFIMPYMRSEDFNMISADIERAYKDVGYMYIPTLDEQAYIQPVYSAEVLMQVENSRHTRQNFDVIELNDSWNITKDAQNNIVFLPTMATNAMATSDEILLNFHSEDVTPEMVAVATRLITKYNLISLEDTNTPTHIGTAGSEIITRTSIWTMTGENWTATPTYLRSDYSDASLSVLGAYQTFSKISTFDWHPIIGLWDISSPTEGVNVYDFVGYIADLDNYTFITTEMLNKMNDVALLSMFGIEKS